MTLLQLNRHLDDIHANLEEIEQDEVKTWFKAQMTKAKKFQPLAVLNQKLKGLDVFESNDPLPLPAHSISQPGYSTPEPATVVSPEELVTRAHWQRPGPRDVCSDPICGRKLGGPNGTVNCRKCGKLFCEEHTMYQMKLSRSAQHEPIRGVWCRVCETCYKSREGYNDHNGLERNHTDAFIAIRRKTVDRSYLEVSRLEKRLTKLTQLLANPVPTVGSGNGLWPLSSAKAQQRALEQSVIDWEDDASVTKCPFCQQEFSNYTSLGGFRRHHCRLCGRVVCGDPRTECSSEVGLNVATSMFIKHLWNYQATNHV
jgi:rabenosyn-5